MVLVEFDVVVEGLGEVFFDVEDDVEFLGVWVLEDCSVIVSAEAVFLDCCFAGFLACSEVVCECVDDGVVYCSVEGFVGFLGIDGELEVFGAVGVCGVDGEGDEEFV